MARIVYGIRKAKPTQSMRGIMMSECYGESKVIESQFKGRVLPTSEGESK